MIPFFGLLETPAELKINLSCTVSCSALNCTVVQWCKLHGSSVLYCTTLYCTIQFCNTLYCIVMYWSLMQNMVLSVLLQKGVAVAMFIVNHLQVSTDVNKYLVTESPNFPVYCTAQKKLANLPASQQTSMTYWSSWDSIIMDTVSVSICPPLSERSNSSQKW